MAKQGIRLPAAAGVEFLLDVGVDAMIRDDVMVLQNKYQA